MKVMTSYSQDDLSTPFSPKQIIRHLVFVFYALMLSSCGTKKEFYPKPFGYHRIDLPQHSYQKLREEGYPYLFDYSKEAKITKDTSWITEPYWIDIIYPALGANIQITYKPVKRQRALLEEYLNDSYKLTAKHNVKAYAIEEQIIALPGGQKAAIYELSGEVPSQFQFSVTDSTDHFLRGALYFNEATKNDSLKPIIEYIKIDMVHMLNTLRWD